MAKNKYVDNIKVKNDGPMIKVNLCLYLNTTPSVHISSEDTAVRIVIPDVGWR